MHLLIYTTFEIIVLELFDKNEKMTDKNSKSGIIVIIFCLNNPHFQ